MIHGRNHQVVIWSVFKDESIPKIRLLQFVTLILYAVRFKQGN